ncbi:MAG: glycoside hydrolase family 76 protein [Candidatus Cloacimonetes bacterium]|nr:glycoside hydrolase family 76 protein [Candidatus Cloacimonadota bacterium]
MNRMKNLIIVLVSLLWLMTCACGENGPDKGFQEPPPQEERLAERSLTRAIELADNTINAHFTGSGMAMARYYNPYTGARSDEKGSVWMYTSAIEAVNAILHALQAEKVADDASLYNKHYTRFVEVLDNLYDNADYYLGTFSLTSYTQTKEWTVYGVNRGASKGGAKVEGIENVYDDQMWLVRELMESYKLTGKETYLEKAEYLTEYVLDGWDCTIDANGNEVGGITWGPGYVTKHACSNGPMVSPLVWLHELYKEKNDEVIHRFIDAGDMKTRKTVSLKKSDYYLAFAKKIYEWQKEALLRGDGVYDDMMGGCTPGAPQLETIDGVTYRKGITCRDKVGPAISYNSGTMLSGAADLYRATADEKYLSDGKKLSDASFAFFAKKGTNLPDYYTYNISGFNNWFNGVLMRGYVDLFPANKNVSTYIATFQQNLDYGYDHFLYKGFLPTNLLVGWSQNNSNNRIEGMFSFAFAAEYAVLSRYELTK